METSLKSPIGDLAKKGFVKMTYPATLRRDVHKAMSSWKPFCSLAADIKRNLPYSNGGAGVGYELKDGAGPSADRKENFDVSLAGLEWLQSNAAQIGNPVALQFVKDAVAVVTELKPLILDFARQAEEAYKLPGFAKEVEASEDRFFVRFIHYFGDRQPGDVTAEAHPDQSGFTPHLFESAPGLQCLTFDGEWIDMPVSEGETVVIPAMQLQLRSEGKLKALIHRVIATPKTAEEGRYSAVCFVQLKDTAKYDKDRCGRLQETQAKFTAEGGKAGFNYGMSHVEFAGMFK